MRKISVIGGPLPCERIAGAAPPTEVLNQNTARKQIGDIAQCRIRRTFLDLRLLGRRQLALETIEQPVKHVALPRR